jgi:hypothetical protein
MGFVSWAHAQKKISNELWAALELLIAVFTPSPKGGRRRTVDDRAALNGILYVLQTGVPWEDLRRNRVSQRHDTGDVYETGKPQGVGATASGDGSPVACTRTD